MYRLLVKQCEKPHNLTGRKRYRAMLCYFVHDHKRLDYVTSTLFLDIPSTKRYRKGTFVNPTKIVKQYLAERNLQKV